MPQFVVWAVSYIGASVGSAAMMMYAVEIASAIMVVGGLAYSASQSAKARRNAKDQYNAAQVDRLVNIVSSTSPRELVLGRVRKAGTIFYRASTGADSQDLYIAIALAGHEVDGIEGYYLNDQLVTVDGAGWVTSAPYATSTNLTYTSVTYPTDPNLVPGSVIDVYASTEAGGFLHYSYQVAVKGSTVKITPHLGTAGQAVDASLQAAFPADWSSSNVVQGVAYVVVKLTYNESAFPTGAPAISVLVRGAKIYDPRTGLTAFSENPALMCRHVMMHPSFGKATSMSAAEDARIIAAANACDTPTVYQVAGVAQPSRPLYTAALVVPFGATADSILHDLAQAMGGSTAFMAGELYLKAGVYTAPVMDIADADLAVIQRDGASETQRPIGISVHRERAQKFNTVKATIWDAGQDYKQTPLTALTGAALLARDGAELVQEVQMPAVSYAPQAQHIAGIMMRDARDALAIELPCKLRVYPLELFDTVTLTLSRYGWVSKQFMVLGRSWAADGSISLTLKETAAAITQMDADFLAQGFAANTNLPKPWQVQDVGLLTVTSGTAELLKQSDGTIVSRMRVSWPQVTDMAVQQSGRIEVQYRAATSTGAWTSLLAEGTDTQIVTADVQDGMVYIIRARARNSLAVGNWNVQVSHQVIGKTEPPPAFDFFSVMAQPDGTRQYNFGYVATARPLDWLGAEIRYVGGTTTTPDWATMMRLQDATTHYTSSPVELNFPLSGVYTFACKSIDTSGNLSTLNYVNITLPDRRLGNVFDEFFEGADGWMGTKTGCHVQEGILVANDATTWATLPATWAAWTRWIVAPSSPIYYESPVRDFVSVIAAAVNPTVDADGTIVQEIATSADGTTWSAWSSAAAPFTSRYIKLRITLTANGTYPVPVLRDWRYEINAPMRSEYLNDIVASALTGVYRIGVGDIRIPLAGVYTVLKNTTVTIQDSRAGTWTSQRIDQSMTPAPRWQFKLNSVLTDPAFVDFYIEGY